MNINDFNWSVNDVDIVWLQLGLMFIGILFIIIGLFKRKDTHFTEEKIESLFEEFITRMDIENEEIISEIKKAQNEVPHGLKEILNELEHRIQKIEQGESISVQSPIKQKYEEVLKLYQAGENIDNIAKKTQIGHGEILLILELSKKGFKYA